MLKYLLLIALLLLGGCNNSNFSEINQQHISSKDVSIKNVYRDKKFKTEITIPKKFQDVKINMDMKMSDGNFELSDLKLKKHNNKYFLETKIPKEGIWNIRYKITYQKQTLLKSYTEVLGKPNLDKERLYALEIQTDPKEIVPKKDVNFMVRLLNKENRNIENGEVILQFEQKEYNFSYINMMENKKDYYDLKLKFPRSGIYELTIHVEINGEQNYKRIKIPVGSTN
ncbi:hypothetical protein MKY25_00990 [Geobacillus sp. FSL W8-0032]|uniref:YtkA-like domain-containing protein n=1 Tax=Geobacillus icigianus TaxID=1430331 RepID=A0ABU6BKR8_9BACL|nr:hypothetical protein [Geobacillus icigianus]MEB3752616.1 hypothetical protein [Geobacillus icigianus]